MRVRSFITAASRDPLSLTALWNLGEAGGQPIESFTILTTDATAALADIHHRQPAIIKADDFDE